MTDSIRAAVAKRDNSPAAMLDTYKSDFALVLPSMIRPETFVRVAQGLLRRNDKLRQTAENNPQSFMAAMLECARLGLEPGDTFHFVPMGREIVGITDYTGEIELIYRAGEAASVKAEIVYSKDQFDYSPDMDRPIHKVDWFGDRGDMIGVYAYAVMKNGSTSRVVVMSRADVDKVKAVSKTANGSDSPWRNWEDRMWLKTAVKQLAKWVPSSAEYRQHAARDQAAARQVEALHDLPAPAADIETGEIIDGELAEDPPATYDELRAEANG